jgi:hypothetical protein
MPTLVETDDYPMLQEDDKRLSQLTLDPVEQRAIVPVLRSLDCLNEHCFKIANLIEKGSNKLAICKGAVGYVKANTMFLS